MVLQRMKRILGTKPGLAVFTLKMSSSRDINGILAISILPKLLDSMFIATANTVFSYSNMTRCIED